MPTSTDDVLPIVENEEARPPSPASVARRSPQDNELDLQPSGCGSSMCCNPASGVHRFIALIFMCLLGFGECNNYYYVYLNNKKVNINI